MLEDISDTNHVIVDYRVGIRPCNFNKCNGGAMLLRKVVFNWTNKMKDCSVEHDIAGISARICTTLENSGNVSNL